MPTDQNIIKVDINDILPNKSQPRKVFNEESIKELAVSIKNYGILNPLLVRKITSGYEIIAGERRYRAAKMLGLKEVPVLVKNLSDNEVRELALIENIQRKNLNPIEEAEAFKEILSIKNINQEELSKKIGKSQSVISNKMRLLNLSSEAKEAILNGKISEHHGRTLLKLNEEEQNQLLNQIIEKKLSVKETEEIINKKNSKENIKNILNSIDIDNTDSNTFNDMEPEIKEKGEEKMNNNLSMGNFFPQMDNSNSNINNNLSNDTIMFNNSPIDTNQQFNNEISFNNDTTTVPLNTLNQEPTISTIDSPINSNVQIQENVDISTPQSNINHPEENNTFIGQGLQTSIPNNNRGFEINIDNEPVLTQPLYNNQESIGIPQINNLSIDTTSQPTLETPLFTNPIAPPEVDNIELTEPSISQDIQNNNILTETTINPLPTIELSPIDTVKNAINNLNNPNIMYKEYNNENEYCIIITIKK